MKKPIRKIKIEKPSDMMKVFEKATCIVDLSNGIYHIPDENSNISKTDLDKPTEK